MTCPAFPPTVQATQLSSTFNGCLIPVTQCRSDFECLVTDVPTGKETGTFLAMDLGGTNIRACSVQLKGDGTFNMIQSKTVVPASLQTAKTSSELFGFIADHLKHFLDEYHPEHCEKDHNDKSECYRLGFTFSFPVIQTSINSGKLLRWTKGFSIEVKHRPALLAPFYICADKGRTRSIRM